MVLPRLQTLILVDEVSERDGDIELVRVRGRSSLFLSEDGLATKQEVLLEGGTGNTIV